MQKILIVAYFFPPVSGIGAAGSQRVVKFAKYLLDYRWQPVVLTVKETSYESYLSLDRTLLEKVPSEIKIIRTAVVRRFAKVLELQKTIKARLFRRKALSVAFNGLSPLPNQLSRRERYQSFKNALTDLFEIPDEEIGWFLPGVFAGLCAIRRESIDAIYSTGTPWTALLIGVVLKLLTRKPLVVDFRDPWITNPFRIQRSAFKSSLEVFLEKKVIEKADIVIANTQELQQEFLRRFPEQPRAKFMTLLNGFDSDDFTFEVTSDNDNHARRFIITHTGFLYGKRDPKVFFDAVKWLFDEHLIDRQKLKIFLIGSVELPYNLAQYLADNDLHEVVVLHDHVPYRQSLEYLLRSDALLLLQPGTTTQVPSKLFEYIGMRKPILAITPHGGATYRLVLSERLGAVADPDNVQEIGRAIYAFYQAWMNDSLSSMIDSEAYLKFDVKHIAASLSTALSQLTVA